MMLLLHAQGGGFYGCAIATISLSLDEAARRLRKAHKSNSRQTGELVSLELELNDDDFVTISEAPVGLSPVPRAVVLFDTGHADEDFAAAQSVLSALHDPAGSDLGGD